MILDHVKLLRWYNDYMGKLLTATSTIWELKNFWLKVKEWSANYSSSGFDCHVDDEVSKPPDFESPINFADPNRELHSQIKSGNKGSKARTVAARSQPQRRCKHMPQASSQTSIADLQIAKEALEIEELLGLKIISNKLEATRRITNTLKKVRKLSVQREPDKQTNN